MTNPTPSPSVLEALRDAADKRYWEAKSAGIAQDCCAYACIEQAAIDALARLTPPQPEQAERPAAEQPRGRESLSKEALWLEENAGVKAWHFDKDRGKWPTMRYGKVLDGHWMLTELGLPNDLPIRFDDVECIGPIDPALSPAPEAPAAQGEAVDRPAWAPADATHAAEGFVYRRRADGGNDYCTRAEPMWKRGTNQWADLAHILHPLKPAPAAPAVEDNCNACQRCLAGKVNDAGIPITASQMILCPQCGNKRCPKATDHRYACTGSNALNQVPTYAAAQPQEEGRTRGEMYAAVYDCVLKAVRGLTPQQFADRLTDAAMPVVASALAAAGEREKVGDWISVYKQMPDKGNRVECWAPGWSSVAHGWWAGDHYGWRVWFGEEVSRMRPDRWRPLPAPPAAALSAPANAPDAGTEEVR